MFWNTILLAFREIKEWKFTRPVFFGDTVHGELEVVETKEMRRIGGGMVVIDVIVKNQKGEAVMNGSWTALIASRPAAQD